MVAPLRVGWQAQDAALPAGGRFALFIDRTPIAPGESLKRIARDDRSCRATPGCPDDEYLRKNNVFVTSATEVSLDTLPRLARNASTEVHHLTLVVVDGHGVRTNEASWSLDVRYSRK